MKRALLDRILSERAARRPFVVATRLPDGRQVLIAPSDDGDGDEIVVAALKDAARSALARDAADTVEIDGESWLVAPHNPPIRLLVVGAVHITQALVPLAQLVGFEVTVIDPRRSFGSLERFPDVTLTNEWPEPALTRLGPDARTAVVTLSHDKKLDDPAIAFALRSPAAYIGALGSRKTQDARNERLRAESFSDDDLQRIHGPIGLPIGARSPAEVALAIVAEIVQTLRAAAPR